MNLRPGTETQARDAIGRAVDWPAFDVLLHSLDGTDPAGGGPDNTRSGWPEIETQVTAHYRGGTLHVAPATSKLTDQ